MEEFDGPVLHHHDESMPPVEPGVFGFGLSRRSFVTGAGAAAMAAFLAACGSSSKETSSATSAAGTTTPVTTANAIPQAGTTTSVAGTTTTAGGRPEATTETITIGVASLQEAYVDPQWAVGGLVFPLMWAISDFLYMQNQDGKFVPTLATGYTLSDDKLKWTFKLRQGIKMHDGSTFTAKDVKTAVDRVTTGPNAKDFTHLANFKANVTGANVVDDYTVEVVTSKPYATLIVDMSPPIATDYYNKVGDAEFKKKPVCSGPWKFVSQELNANVKYDRHDDYWDKTRKPNWKKLVYAIVPDEQARVAGIKTGTLDIAFGLTASTADGLKSDAGVKVTEIKETGMAYCMMYDNVYVDQPSALKDVNVRKALLMAIDRDSIGKALYKGYATTPASATPRITPGFNPDRKPVPYDPDGAKKLLAAAGQSNLTLTLNTYNTTTIPDMVKLTEAVQQSWAAIGVKAEINNVEAATYLTSFRAKNSLKGAAMIAGPSFFYIEPARLSATSFFWSKAPYTPIVGDAKLDALVDSINVETDFDKRAALGRQQADYIDDTLYGLPIIVTSSLVATGPKVASFGFILSNPYAGPTGWIVAK